MYSIFISNIDSKSQWSKVQTNKQLKKIANSTFHHKNMDIFLFTWIFILLVYHLIEIINSAATFQFTRYKELLLAYKSHQDSKEKHHSC